VSRLDLAIYAVEFVALSVPQFFFWGWVIHWQQMRRARLAIFRRFEAGEITDMGKHIRLQLLYSRKKVYLHHSAQYEGVADALEKGHTDYKDFQQRVLLARSFNPENRELH
jgi:hypothetical protein